MGHQTKALHLPVAGGTDLIWWPPDGDIWDLSDLAAIVSIPPFDLDLRRQATCSVLLDFVSVRCSSKDLTDQCPSHNRLCFVF
jgi:hypothetical protein